MVLLSTQTHGCQEVQNTTRGTFSDDDVFFAGSHARRAAFPEATTHATLQYFGPVCSIMHQVVLHLLPSPFCNIITCPTVVV